MAEHQGGSFFLSRQDHTAGEGEKLTPEMEQRIETLALVSPTLLVVLSAKSGAAVAENKQLIKDAIENPREVLSRLPPVEKMRIAKALEQIKKVPEGAKLVDALDTAGIKMTLRKEGGGVFWSYPDRIGTEVYKVPLSIEAGRGGPQGDIVQVLTHELQHLRQALELGGKYQGRVPHPDNVLQTNRFIEADAQATATEVAYQLKKLGYKGAWEQLTDPNCWTRSIAEAYEKAMQNAPEGSNANAVAKRAAFDAWFQAKYPSWHGGPLMADIYNDQGLKNYPAAPDLAELAKSGARLDLLSEAELKLVGSLSDTNYLDLPSGRPMSDPYYRQLNLTPEQVALRNAHIAEYEKLANQFNSAATPKPPAPAPAPAPDASVGKPPHIDVNTGELPVSTSPSLKSRIAGAMTKAGKAVDHGMDGVSVVTGTIGAIDAAKKGDVAGVVVNGADAGVGATSIALNTAKAMGAKVAPTLTKVVRGSNVVLLVATGTYQVATEKGNFIDHEADGSKSLGNKGERAAAVVTTAVVGIGLAAAGVGTLGVVPAVIATAYIADKAIDARREWKENQKQITEKTKPERIKTPAPDEKPSIHNFKHLGDVLVKVSPNMMEHRMTKEPPRGKDGKFTAEGARELDLTDPKNRVEFERAIETSILQQEAIMKANDSMLPQWMRSGDAAQKYADAAAELAELRGARAEMAWYKTDLLQYQKTHPQVESAKPTTAQIKKAPQQTAM